MAYHVDDPTLETPRNYTTTRDVTVVKVVPGPQCFPPGK
jgi:hypothetical protein